MGSTSFGAVVLGFSSGYIYAEHGLFVLLACSAIALAIALTMIGVCALLSGWLGWEDD